MIDQNKLEKFFTKELSGLQEVFILDCGDGSYELFNTYRVEPNKGETFLVRTFTTSEEHVFSTLRNAFTWCIFDKNKKIKECKRIEELDLLGSSLDVSIIQQKRLLSKSKDADTKLIYLAKLNEAKLKKRSVIKEINGYINISKYWQSNKFLDKHPK